MTIPVFPRLRPTWPVVMRPTWASIVATSVSGREVRSPQQAYPLYEFELTIEVLRDESPNANPYRESAGWRELQAIVGLYNSLAGQYGTFYFDFAQDDSRQGQAIGTGNGVAVAFFAQRTIGIGSASLTEPVGGINVLDTVYVDGVAQATNAYSFSGNVITFRSAPGAGKLVSIDFSFYYRCRFLDDHQEFTQFMYNLWEIKTLRFRSVKA